MKLWNRFPFFLLLTSKRPPAYISMTHVPLKKVKVLLHLITYTHINKHTYTLIHTFIHTNTRTNRYTHSFTNIYMQTYTHKHSFMHAYIQINMHTHIRINTYTCHLHIFPSSLWSFPPVALTVLIGGTHTGSGHFEVGNVSFDYWFT